MTTPKRLRTALTIVGLAVFFIAPLSLQAQETPTSDFKNPLKNIGTFSELLIRVIQWLLGISAFLAMLALVWGGIRFITALDNEQHAQKAKEIIKWAVVGLAVIGLSFVIINTLTTLLGIGGAS